MFASSRSSARVLAWWLTASMVAGGAVLVANQRPEPGSLPRATIGGPYANLLAGSTDLDPSRLDQARLTAGLRESTRPESLQRWAASKGLEVRWQPGEQWACRCTTIEASRGRCSTPPPSNPRSPLPCVTR
jgi:kumamolisin